MNHLTIGAAVPFVFLTAWYIFRRFRASLLFLLCAPAWMLAGSTWAVLPDLPRTFGFAEYDRAISDNPIIDIFFWHYTMNLHESYSPWFNIAFVAMVLALFAVALRELYLLEEKH